MGCENCNFMNSCIKVTTKNKDYLFHCDSGSTFDPVILEQSERLDKLSEFGYTKEDSYFENRHVTAEDVEQFLATDGYTQLVLSISYACNFRCKYCYYGDSYPESREHQGILMSWATAKAAIDVYMQLLEKYHAYHLRRRGCVVFYGGEPLLNFTVLKQCVEYIETTYPTWNILYNLTTNGSLLNDEARKFFVQHDFVVNVSFDGPREQHDRLRVTAEGKPTFDMVYPNIVEYSKLLKRSVNCISVFDPKTNLLAVADFFDNNKYVNMLTANAVKDTNGHYYDQFDKEDYLYHHEQKKKIFERLMKDVGDDTKLFGFASRFYVGAIARFIDSIPNIGKINPKLIRMTGGCVPGNKIHVTPDGNFYMCEKCLTTHSFGDVKNGIDFQKVADLVNEYNNKTQQCISCQYRQVCHMCQSFIEKDDSYYIDGTKCNVDVENNLRQSLEIAYAVIEKNPVWARNTSSGYYDSILKNCGGTI